MWNPRLYQEAIKFAGEAHTDQLVPGTSANYLLHLSIVAMEIFLAYQAKPCFDINLALQVALLHDVLEDTAVTRKTLEEKFGAVVASGVQALTKNTHLPKEAQMPDSLLRIKLEAKEVSMVKLADRITNLQKPPAHWSKEKSRKYQAQARLILKELKGRNEHLENRLAEVIENYDRFA